MTLTRRGVKATLVMGGDFKYPNGDARGQLLWGQNSGIAARLILAITPRSFMFPAFRDQGLMNRRRGSCGPRYSCLTDPSDEFIYSTDGTTDIVVSFSRLQRYDHESPLPIK